MTSIHEPTPEFERYLEWQVTTALRRQERFARPVGVKARTRLGTIAIVLASMLVGAAGVAASGRIQDHQQTQVLVEQQRGDLRVAEMQLEIAQQTLGDARKRADIGVTGTDAVAVAQRDVQKAALQVQRVQVNIDEVSHSGRPVQDDVTSPLVGGQDYVVRRLQLDVQTAAIAVATAQQDLQKARSRFDVGLSSRIDVSEAEASVVRASGEMRTIDQKIVLRQQFVAGKITADEATRQRLLITARNGLQTAQSALNVAQQRYTWLQQQFKAGAVGQADLLRAQLDVVSRRQDLTTLQARIQMLEQGTMSPDVLERLKALGYVVR